MNDIPHDKIAFVKEAQTGTKDPTGFVNFISAMVMVYESTKDYLRLVKQLHQK